MSLKESPKSSAAFRLCALKEHLNGVRVSVLSPGELVGFAGILGSMEFELRGCNGMGLKDGIAPIQDVVLMQSFYVVGQ